MAERFGLLLALALLPNLAVAEISAARQVQLRHMLTHDCGSCHGLRMNGGLGPALTPAKLANREAPALAAIILHGVPGTPMPPWKALMSAEEARWLAELMKTNPPNGSPKP